MKKYNELFGIIHEKWHDTYETKIRNIWYLRSETRGSNQQVCTPNSISEYLWLEFLIIH